MSKEITELDIYKFFTKKFECEIHNEGKYIALLNLFNADEFGKMFTNYLADGIDIYINDRNLGIDLDDLCEYYGFEAKEIFG